MRKIENLERHIRTLYDENLPAGTSAEMDRRVLGNATHRIDNVREAGLHPQTAWRAIMNSRTARLSTVAVVLIVAILGAHVFFRNGVTMANIIENMNKQQWMHAAFEAYESPGDSGIAPQADGIKESWTSLDPYCHAQVSGNGDISFWKEESGRLVSSRYDPTINTIVTTYQETGGEIGSGMPGNFLRLFLEMIGEIEETGGSVTHVQDTHEGRPAWIVGFEGEVVAGPRLRGSLIVDRETNLPVRFSVDCDNRGQLDSVGSSFSALIDYPDAGPTTIYEAGAPRDARIKVVDDNPQVRLGPAIEEYQRARESLDERYTLVEILVDDLDVVRTVAVTYRDGQRKRRQECDVDKKVALPGRDDSVDSVIDWFGGLEIRSYNMVIEDGERTYSAYPGANGAWSATERRTGSVIVANSRKGLPNLGWPLIAQNTNPVESCELIENDFAAENGLLCFERYHEGLYQGDKVLSVASRNHFYIDPQRGYLCVRQETFGYNPADLRVEPGEGPVQMDIATLDIDPRSTPSEPSTVIEIVEFSRTSEGQWYPKKIRKDLQMWIHSDSGGWKPSPRIESTWIYLDTNASVPEEIFDLKNLPK